MYLYTRTNIHASLCETWWDACVLDLYAYSCARIRIRIQCISRSLWLEAIWKLYSKRLAFNPPGETRCWRSAMECWSSYYRRVFDARFRCQLIRKMGNRFDCVHEDAENLNFELRHYLTDIAQFRWFISDSTNMCMYMLNWIVQTHNHYAAINFCYSWRRKVNCDVKYFFAEIWKCTNWNRVLKFFYLIF